MKHSFNLLSIIDKFIYMTKHGTTINFAKV